MSVKIESVDSKRYDGLWTISIHAFKNGKPYLAQADLSSINIDSSFISAHHLEDHELSKFLDMPIYYFNRLIVPEAIRCNGLGTELVSRLELRTDRPIYNPISYYGVRANIKTGEEDLTGEWYKDWLISRGWYVDKINSFGIYMPQNNEGDKK